MHSIDGIADWPYLQASTTGTAPLTISDLRTVEHVSSVGGLLSLQPATRTWLRDQYVDLTVTGTPIFYYFIGSQINVYPASTSTTLTVDYLKVVADLSAGADVPLIPDRFRMAIVHYAAAAAREDRGDLQGAMSAKGQGDAMVAQMQVELLTAQHQAPESFVPPVGSDL
jgi:hypothetical protein